MENLFGTNINGKMGTLFRDRMSIIYGKIQNRNNILTFSNGEYKTNKKEE